MHLQQHLNILRGESYDLMEINTDRQASFSIFEGNFPDISVKQGGAGDRVPEVDECCKMTKNM